jgi:hypothetical protein
MDLKACGSCGRKFNPEAYERHSKICKKVFRTKRKKFNSQAKRISNEQKRLMTLGKRNEQVKMNGKANTYGVNKWKI